MALVGFCGSRYVHWSWAKLVAHVVATISKDGRGIAVTGSKGASWPVLRNCFATGWHLRAPAVQVFTAFDQQGHGRGQYSARDLLAHVDRAAKAPGNAKIAHRIKINWLAGGDASLPLERRLKTRSAAMVAAVQGSGQGHGLIAFVTDTLEKSSEAWYTIKLAHQSDVPVVVFGLGCAVADFPPLGKGRWVVAGDRVWASAWRWVEGARKPTKEEARRAFVSPERWQGKHGDPIEEEPRLDRESSEEETSLIFRLLGWKPRQSPRKQVKLNFPLVTNLARWARSRS